MGKKLLKIFASLALATLLACSAIACSGSNWSGKVNLTTPGNVVSNGGFIAETENYIYFVNGKEDSTSKNTFGVPVKGSIMVAEKSKLGTENAISEIVVPKIISNGDYSSGLYVFNGSIYYATPSTKKDSSGNIANSYLDFCSTTLDGTTKTKTYFTLKGNSTEFRFVEKDGTVYIAYYDAEEKTLFSYNTSDKSKVEVVKEPASYNIIKNEGTSSAVFVYTINGKDESNNDDSTFNKVYYYSVGNTEATLLFDGSKDKNGNALTINIKYAITLVKGNYIFYSTTESKNEEIVKYYGATVNNFISKTDNYLYEKNDNIADTSLFIDLENLYVVDSGFIAKVSYNNGKAQKELINKADASTLLFVKDNYIYYYNSKTEIARISLTEKGTAKEERVSESTVNNSWFTPKVIGDYVMYLDSTTLGCNYVNYVPLTQTATLDKNDTEDDETDDFYYLEKIYFLGEVNSADTISKAITKISDLSSYTKLTVEDGKIAEKDKIAEARNAYEALTKKQKKEISDESIESLNKYELYVKISEKLLVLLNDYETSGFKITSENKSDYQNKIDEINKLIKDNNLYSNTDFLIENGMNAKQKIEKMITDFSK